MAAGKKGKQGKQRKARGASTRSRKGAPPRRRSRAARQAEQRVVKAVRFIRQGKSLTSAAKAAHSDPRTIKKYARAALRRREGTYAAVPVDQMHRPLRVLTPEGLQVVDVRSSRTASRVAQHWGAVDHYLRTGDRRRLAPFMNKRFRAHGRLVPFVTDPYQLEQLANAGEVRFEDLYETVA